MPGIAGIILKEGDPAIERWLDAMLESMTYRDDGNVVRHLEDGDAVALGVTSLGVYRDQSPELLARTASTSVVFDGELYGERPQEILSAACGGDSPTAFSDLSGEFALACCDQSGRTLRLISDKLGRRPLYYARVPGGLVFASEVKALLHFPGVSRSRDDQAFGDFYRYGFVLGNKTLFAGVRLLPPGTVLSFDRVEGKLDLTAYWSVDELFASAGQHDARGSVEDVADRFAAAVGRRLGDIGRLGVSLSGGLDSRAVLAAMGERARGVASYTLGLPGCQDEKLSASLARLAGTRHTFLELGAEYLGDFAAMARSMIHCSDGLYHPHESTEKRALDYFEEAPFRVVLRGHGGEIAKAALAYPVQATPGMPETAGGVVEYLYHRANLGIRDVDPALLFAPDVAETMVVGARASLEEAVAPVRDRVAAADLCVHFYLTQWVRRQVVASLAIFRTQTEVRLPFLDEAFLKLLLQLPVRRRWDGEVQGQVVRRCMPELVKVPNSNTGAPLDAGRLRLFLVDKFNSVLKRLSVPGFRHYTEFERWQREQFRDSMETILFDPRTLDRGLYREDGLRQLFDAHVAGRRNLAHLLGTAVGLELWHREFVDG